MPDPQRPQRPQPDPRRPLPAFPEPDTEPFWTATAEHRLTYQVCLACGQVVFHPRRHCTGCTSGRLEWRACAGAGTVYTYTVIRQNGHPFFRAAIPYVVALTRDGHCAHGCTPTAIC